MGEAAPVRALEAPAPVRAPLPLWEASPGEVTLGLANVGSIRVTPEVITVLAPDEEAVRRTWDRLGTWAQGQWHAMAGDLVLRGASVARDGRALAIVGAPRTGTSLTALQTIRHGFRLMRDGIVVIRDGVAIAQDDPRGAVDLEAAEVLFADLPCTPRGTERPRVDVEAPAATDTPLTSIALLGISLGRREITVRGIDPPYTQILSLAVQRLDQTQPVHHRLPERISARSFSRSVPVSMDDIRRQGPQAMAAAIVEHLGSDA
jgi:hypothetical protein